jgi:hypothetical protein
MIQFCKEDLVNWANEAEAETEMNDAAMMEEEAMKKEGKDNFPNPLEGFQTTKRTIPTVSGYSNSGMFIILCLSRPELDCQEKPYFCGSCSAAVYRRSCPLYFRWTSTPFHFFSEFGVHQFKGSPWDLEDASRLSRIQPDIWCLVDANIANPTPAPFLQWRYLSIIEASNISPPPRRINPEWRKKIDLQMVGL